VETRISGYQETRVQDTRISGHQENRGPERKKRQGDTVTRKSPRLAITLSACHFLKREIYEANKAKKFGEGF
jgi:hypothetical protein